MNADDGEMTLAFSLDAAQRLAAPEDVFVNASTWSQHVGIVSEDHRTTEQYIRNYGFTQDFFTGEHDKAESLTLINRQIDTDRYVYLGANENDPQAANAAGWEYLPIEEAAVKADWKLVPTDGVSGFARAIQFLKDLL